MLCENCGNKLLDNAAFCSNCGLKVNHYINEEDNDIQIRVKPTFNFIYTIFPAIIAIFILFILSLVIMNEGDKNFGILFFLIISGIVLLITLIKTFLIKKQYEKMIYDFYKTKIIYRDSFLNISEKEVKYKYIREINLKQNFIQRFFNLGSIILYTNAESGSSNGILIQDVLLERNIFKKIKSIVNNKK